MFVIIFLAVMAIIAFIVIMVALTVWKDKIHQWTVKLLLRYDAMPDHDNPGSPANELYARDLAFNVRIVLYFIAAFGIIIMLVLFAAMVGIGFLGYIL